MKSREELEKSLLESQTEYSSALRDKPDDWLTSDVYSSYLDDLEDDIEIIYEQLKELNG